MAKIMKMRGSKKYSQEPQADLKLKDAAKAGITVKIGRTNDLSRIGLMLTNTTSEPARVELVGAVLMPSDNDYQRLLVAGAQSVEDYAVEIAPGAKRELTLETCCMDRSKSCPDEGVSYKVGSMLAPDNLLRASHRFVESKLGKTSSNPDRIAKRGGVDEKVKVGLDYVQSVCWGGKE